MPTSLSRRSLLGGVLGTALTAGLVGCSTSTTSSSSSSSGTNLVLWMWPSGIPKETIGSIPKAVEGITVRQDLIGGDFKQKLVTAFQGRRGLPAISGVKGEDIAYFTSRSDNFVDLRTLDAEKFKDDYLDWKWAQGTAPDGSLIGFPIDTGPTVLYYRIDILESAGLPTDPAELGRRISSWDAFFDLGKELTAKRRDTWLIRNASGIFDTAWKQNGKGFVDNHVFIGDQDQARAAWQIAMKAISSGSDGAMQSNTTDTAAAVASGKLPADIGASWHLSDLEEDAPDTKGKWRICHHPGKATNNGGSFLTIPKDGPDHESAFKVITYLENADNQEKEYVLKGHFPSNLKAYDKPALSEGVAFLGGQKAGKIYGEAAKQVITIKEDPMNSTVMGPYLAEIEKVEKQHKNPDQAWKDAVSAARTLARQNGVTVK